jgi:hypothetical protein
LTKGGLPGSVLRGGASVKVLRASRPRPSWGSTDDPAAPVVTA